MRYIQVSVLDCKLIVNLTFIPFLKLVENEDMIGTLIDTNERIIASLEMYDAVGNLSIAFPLASSHTLYSFRNLKSLKKIYRMSKRS